MINHLLNNVIYINNDKININIHVYLYRYLVNLKFILLILYNYLNDVHNQVHQFVLYSKN